jgi:hypothetical protein
VVNVAFDCSNPPVFGMPVFDYYYNYEHLRPVLECGASRVARSPEQLASHVNAYLCDPSLDRGGRRRFAQMHVKMPLAGASTRISEALARIGEGRKTLEQ